MATDFSTITACGECCAECPKKTDGRCPGCIEADGRVPEWAESGRCRVHACTREHHVQFCGLCREFPCEQLGRTLFWNPDIITHMTALRDEYRAEQRPEQDRKELLLLRFVSFSKRILEDRLTGIYLHGSAAMGCYHPEKSDLDLLVVVNGQLTDGEKRGYMDCVAALDEDTPAKGIEMSMVTRDACNPFVYPTPFILHYSAMHRARYRRDPEDYIRKMSGKDKDLAAHLTVIRNRGRCLYGLPVQEVFGPVPEEDYLDSIRQDVCSAEEEIAENPMYLILNLARVLAYMKDKTVLSKQEGGEWGLRNLPEDYHSLIRSALREYGESADVQYDPEQAARYAAFMLKQVFPGK